MDTLLLYTLGVGIYYVQFEQGGRNCDSNIQPVKQRMNSNQAHSVGLREPVTLFFIPPPPALGVERC